MVCPTLNVNSVSVALDSKSTACKVKCHQSGDDKSFIIHQLSSVTSLKYRTTIPIGELTMFSNHTRSVVTACGVGLQADYQMGQCRNQYRDGLDISSNSYGGVGHNSMNHPGVVND